MPTSRDLLVRPRGATDPAIAGVRPSALVAAAGLLGMAVVAPFANAAVPSSASVVGFAAVAALDVVVAAALWLVFRSVRPVVAAAQGLVRLAYTIILVVALFPLAGGDGEGFRAIWSAGLGVFGVHLLLLAWLVWCHPRGPRWIAVLVGVSGAGYVFDGTRSLLRLKGPEVSIITFVGEVILIGWLVWLATRSGGARSGAA